MQLFARSITTKSKQQQLHYNCFKAFYWAIKVLAFLSVASSWAHVINAFVPRPIPRPIPVRTLFHGLQQPREQRQQHVGRRDTPLFMAVGKTGSKVLESSEQYDDMILQLSKKRPIMIFWTAPWCGPCRLSIPVVKDVMKQFSGAIEVAEVCTDDLPDVASEAGIVSIPTIQIWYSAELKDTIIGCVAKSVLASAVKKVLEEEEAQRGVA